MTKLQPFASRASDAADETPRRRELVFVVPGRLNQFTGGYLFDRHIVEGLRARGRVVRVIEFSGGGPKANAAVLGGLADGTETVVDGLALVTLRKAVAAQARRLRLIAFVHGPLAQESGLPPSEAKRAAHREAALLLRLRGIICPSRKTAAAVESYGVSPDRIAIVPPGTVKPNRLRPRRSPVSALLCVANLLPLKGHGVLVEALARIRDLDWHLLCVGSLERNPPTTQMIRRMISAAGLERRITLAGEWPPQSVTHAYRMADAFVLKRSCGAWCRCRLQSCVRPVGAVRSGLLALIRFRASRPHHSMTSSARARIDGGTVRPSALAVLRLITSSNFVGCWTGRSAGLAPLRILPA